MKLYGLKACDTCRKAVKALQAAGYDVTLTDIRSEPLEDAAIDRFLSAFGEDLINRRSTTWRGLSEEERTAAPLALLQRHPALMKRPVIEDDAGGLHLGWAKPVQAALGV